MASDKRTDDADAPLVIASETPPIALTPPRPEAQARGYVEMGYFFAAAGALLFSTKAIALKLAYQEATDAETLLALRMAMSLPIYAVIAAIALRDRRRRSQPLPSRDLVIKSALVGVLGYWFASYTDFLGLEY